MVNRVAPPEFLDDPRPSIADIRGWPLVAGFFALCTVFGLLIWWLTSKPIDLPKTTPNMGMMAADPRPIAGLATDYTQIKQPAPEPPPKQEETKGAPPPASPAKPAPVQRTGGGGTGKKSWREEAREADSKVIEVARQSSAGNTEEGAGRVDGSGRGSGPGGSSAAPSAIYSAAGLTKPYPHQVNARTPIRAHTEQPITTDAPGYVTAMVVSDVYTSDKSCVAIPHGSRLYGETLGEVKEGQVRVTTVWTALQRPEPRNDTIELTRVLGADKDGTPGISGSVNNHWFRKFGFIAASSAIDLGVAALNGRSGGNGTAIIIGGTVAQNARSPLDEFAKRQLDIPPTIEVEPREVSVMLSQHLGLDCFDN